MDWKGTVMVYSKVPADHSEFGGGRGLIDPEVRKDRALTAEEQLIEIYATNPALPDTGAGLEQVPPLGPENFPETATIERP